jgi:hypothetical protein
MAIVRMMQPAINQIVHMVSVRHRRVPAVGAVNMISRMPLRPVSAGVRVRRVDRNHMFIHVIAVHVMQVTIVQVIGVALVFDGKVAATGPVLVGMVFVFYAIAHRSPFTLPNMRRPFHGSSRSLALFRWPGCLPRQLGLAPGEVELPRAGVSAGAHGIRL